MRTALIAGIRANLHALKAVLADIAKAGMDDLVSLGDVVATGRILPSVLTSCTEFAARE